MCCMLFVCDAGMSPSAFNPFQVSMLSNKLNTVQTAKKTSSHGYETSALLSIHTDQMYNQPDLKEEHVLHH